MSDVLGATRRLARGRLGDVRGPRWPGGAAALCLSLLVASGCVAAPDAQSVGDFEPGRWESADGQYFIELEPGGERFGARLPIEKSTPLGTTCDGGWPAASDFSGRWNLPDASNGTRSIRLLDDETPQRIWGLGWISEDNWAVLEYYPCGIDNWPPLWLERVDSD